MSSPVTAITRAITRHDEIGRLLHKVNEYAIMLEKHYVTDNLNDEITAEVFYELLDEFYLASKTHDIFPLLFKEIDNNESCVEIDLYAQIFMGIMRATPSSEELLRAANNGSYNEFFRLLCTRECTCPLTL